MNANGDKIIALDKERMQAMADCWARKKKMNWKELYEKQKIQVWLCLVPILLTAFSLMMNTTNLM